MNDPTRCICDYTSGDHRYLLEQKLAASITRFHIHCRGCNVASDAGEFVVKSVKERTHIKVVGIFLDTTPPPDAELVFFNACVVAAKDNPSVATINLRGSVALLNQTYAWGWAGNKLGTLELASDVATGPLLSHMMAGLSKVMEPTLTELIVSKRGTLRALHGIDDFLASDGAKQLDNFEMSVSDDCGRSVRFIMGHVSFCQCMVQLTHGLSKAPIKSFLFRWFSTSTDRAAALDILATYLRDAPLSKLCLDLGDLSLESERNILSSLCTKTAIRKLELGKLFSRVGGLDEWASQMMLALLSGNPHLHTLEWESCLDEREDVAVRLSAKHPSQQSTWKRMEVKIEAPNHLGTTVEELLGSSLFEGLELLKLTDICTHMGVAQKVVRLLEDPRFNLKELALFVMAYNTDAEVSNLILGAGRLQTLDKLTVTVGYHSQPISFETWQVLADELPTLELSALKIITPRDPDFPEEDEAQKEDLLECLALNECVEDLLVHFGPEDEDDPFLPLDPPDEAFQAELDKIGRRNFVMKARKASKSLTLSVDAGGLPIAALPPLLKAIEARSKTPEENTKLSGNALYSALRAQPLEWWDEVKEKGSKIAHKTEGEVVLAELVARLGTVEVHD